MQPSAPFTTDWMTSATVPEHTSACEQQRHTHSRFSRIQEKRESSRAENDESRMILHKRNSYLALLSLNHVNGLTAFHRIVHVIVCGSFLQSVSAWVLWGEASAAEAPSHTSHSKQGPQQQNSLLLLLATSSAVPAVQSSSLASAQQHLASS